MIFMIPFSRDSPFFEISQYVQISMVCWGNATLPPVRPFYRKLVRSHIVNGYHQHNPCTLNFQRRSPPSLKRTAREGKHLFKWNRCKETAAFPELGAFRPMFRCDVWLFVSGRVYLEWDLGGDNCSSQTWMCRWRIRFWLFYLATAPIPGCQWLFWSSKATF